MTLANFMKKRPYLIWWVKDFSNIRAESVVEATLNYGDWEDVQMLIKMLGIKKVARIFRAKSPKSAMGRTNYRPEAIRYFSQYFTRHA